VTIAVPVQFPQLTECWY